MGPPQLTRKSTGEGAIDNHVVVWSCDRPFIFRQMNACDEHALPSTMRTVKSSRSGVDPEKTIGPSMPWRAVNNGKRSERDDAHIFVFFRLHVNTANALQTEVENGRNARWQCLERVSA